MHIQIFTRNIKILLWGYIVGFEQNIIYVYIFKHMFSGR